MNRMTCRISDGPDYDDVFTVDYPDPMTLYGELQNGLADELVLDEVTEISQPHNKTYLAHIFDLEQQCHGDLLWLGRELQKVIREVKERVGETETAREWWRLNVEGL